MNFVEISYHRFTGYQQDAFETANHMQIDFLAYKNPEQFYYNQSLYRLSVGNYDRGFNAAISIYNWNEKSAQDFIHYLVDNTYHLNILDSRRIGFGLDYGYANWNSK